MSGRGEIGAISEKEKKGKQKKARYGTNHMSNGRKIGHFKRMTIREGPGTVKTKFGIKREVEG